MIRPLFISLSLVLTACNHLKPAEPAAPQAPSSPSVQSKPALSFLCQSTLNAEELGFEKHVIYAPLPEGYALYYKITEKSPAGNKENYLVYYNTSNERCAALPLLYMDDALWHEGKATFFKISFRGQSFSGKLRGEGLDRSFPGALQVKNFDGESYYTYHFKEGADEYCWRIDFWVLNNEQAFEKFGVRFPATLGLGNSGVEQFRPNK